MSAIIWRCPWGICNHEDSQKCWNDTRKGCGQKFPRMTPEEAARDVIAPLKAAATEKARDAK